MVDADRKAVLPGFVNSHTHVAAGFYRGILDDWKQGSSLHAVGFPVAAALDAEEYYWLAMLGVVETVKAGATTIKTCITTPLCWPKWWMRWASGP